MYQKITTYLLEFGYKQSDLDRSLFTFKGGLFVAIPIHADARHVLMETTWTKFNQYIKTHLDTNFSIKDLGTLKCFLGIEVASTTDIESL